MLVKELIVKLGEYDMDQRVVADTVDGFLDLSMHVLEGSTDKFTVGEKVVVLAAEDDSTSYDTWFRQSVEKALASTSPTIPHEEAMRTLRSLLPEPEEPIMVTSVVTTKSGEKVIFQVIVNEDGGLDVSVEGSVKSAYIQED